MTEVKEWRVSTFLFVSVLVLYEVLKRSTNYWTNDPRCLLLDLLILFCKSYLSQEMRLLWNFHDQKVDTVVTSQSGRSYLTRRLKVDILTLNNPQNMQIFLSLGEKLKELRRICGPKWLETVVDITRNFDVIEILSDWWTARWWAGNVACMAEEKCIQKFSLNTWMGEIISERSA